MTESMEQAIIESTPDPFAGEFFYRFVVPVGCQQISENPDIHEIQKLDFSNRILLEVLNSSSTQLPHNEEFGTDTQNLFSRLEAKMDLLLRWTGQLIADKLQFPAAIAIDINAHGIKLYAKGTLCQVNPNSLNLILVYLSEHYPEPLRLIARLIHVDQSAHEPVYTLAIENSSEEFSDALEKYIFKVHRQHISNRKKHSHSIPEVGED